MLRASCFGLPQAPIPEARSFRLELHRCRGDGGRGLSMTIPVKAPIFRTSVAFVLPIHLQQLSSQELSSLLAECAAISNARSEVRTPKITVTASALEREVAVPTHRPLSSSFLGLPYRFVNINHKKELLRGLWVSLKP